MSWEASYELALALHHRYPDIDLEEVSLGDIYKWVLELPEFDDDLALVNDDILSAIYLEWYEEVNSL